MHDISYACQMIAHADTGIISKQWYKNHAHIAKKRIRQYKLTRSNVLVNKHGIYDDKHDFHINLMAYTDLNMLWELYNATD